MHRFMLTLMAALPASAALVSCREACVGCRQRAEPLDLLEVYCSMCKECVLRRRHIINERLKSFETRYIRDDSKDLSADFVTRSGRKGIDRDEYPAGCPTPPTCAPDDSYEEVPLPLSTSTSPPTCPPITTCRKKKTTMIPGNPIFPCMPCMPMCPGYCGTGGGGGMTNDPLEKGPSNYHYMYVGVPKNILRRNGQ